MQCEVDRGGARIGEHDRVAIGRGARAGAHGDDAVGAAAVVDHHRLAERRSELGRNDARKRVVAAAGGERNDQQDRAVGIVLRLRGSRDETGNDGENSHENSHRRHSTLRLSLRMSVPHFSLSFAMSAAYSSGDDGSGSPPSAAMRALTSGVSMPAT